MACKLRYNGVLNFNFVVVGMKNISIVTTSMKSVFFFLFLHWRKILIFEIKLVFQSLNHLTKCAIYKPTTDLQFVNNRLQLQLHFLLPKNMNVTRTANWAKPLSSNAIDTVCQSRKNSPSIKNNLQLSKASSPIAPPSHSPINRQQNQLFITNRLN